MVPVRPELIGGKRPYLFLIINLCLYSILVGKLDTRGYTLKSGYM